MKINGIKALDYLTIQIPTYIIGPLKVNGNYANGEFEIPLSTVESPLIPSTSRGIKVANICGGVKTKILKGLQKS